MPRLMNISKDALIRPLARLKAVQIGNPMLPSDCSYDDVVTISTNDIEPTVTWGITPSQGVGINEMIPAINEGATEFERIH